MSVLPKMMFLTFVFVQTLDAEGSEQTSTSAPQSHQSHTHSHQAPSPFSLPPQAKKIQEDGMNLHHQIQEDDDDDSDSGKKKKKSSTKKNAALVGLGALASIIAIRSGLLNKILGGSGDKAASDGAADAG